MRTSAFAFSFLASLRMAAAVPLPGVHTVIETAYTTVWVTAGAATETAAPVTVSSAPLQPATPTTLAAVAAPDTPSETTPAPTQATTTDSPTTQATTQATTEAPTQTTTQATTLPTSTASPAPSGTSLPSSGTNSGQGTYYDTGMGACGFESADTDYIVAISKELFEPHNVDGNPNKNTLCKKKIRAFYGGNSVDVTVVDECVGCKTNDLDFSPSAFSQLANKDFGRIDITWEWV